MLGGDFIENVFRVLGGGNSIGTSCYYLQVDNCSFLLDCGASVYHEPYLPNLQAITKYYLDGIWQLDKVIISHAHFDHFGALPYLLKGEYNLDIICNPITKQMIEFQLKAFNNWENKFTSLGQRQQYELQKERCLMMLKSLPFRQEYKTKDYKITLFPAGHMPGASMIYIETANHNILYTGDFSRQPDLLCGKYSLPENLPVDILIIEGTHAYGQKSAGSTQGYNSIAKLANSKLIYGPVTIETSHITKGIELARFLERYMQNERIDLPTIYLDKVMFPIVETFEQMNFQIYSRHIQPLINDNCIGHDIVIKRKGEGKTWGTVLNGNAFTLHAPSYEIATLINRLQPTTTLIVHATPQGVDNIGTQLNIGDKCYLQTVDNKEYVFK